MTRGLRVGYICPICGFGMLEKPAYDEQGNESFEICSCCGFEYGVDDYNYGLINAFESYRKEWINSGSKWFCPSLEPTDWNLDMQLKNITIINMPHYLRNM